MFGDAFFSNYFPNFFLPGLKQLNPTYILSFKHASLLRRDMTCEVRYISFFIFFKHVNVSGKDVPLVRYSIDRGSSHSHCRTNISTTR